MTGWAKRILIAALILFVFGVLLRLGGYHQQSGFLHGPIGQGITPRAFMDAGATLGIFSIAFGVLGLSGNRSKPTTNEEE